MIGTGSGAIRNFTVLEEKTVEVSCTGTDCVCNYLVGGLAGDPGFSCIKGGLIATDTKSFNGQEGEGKRSMVEDIGDSYSLVISVYVDLEAKGALLSNHGRAFEAVYTDRFLQIFQVLECFYIAADVTAGPGVEVIVIAFSSTGIGEVLLDLTFLEVNRREPLRVGGHHHIDFLDVLHETNIGRGILRLVAIIIPPWLLVGSVIVVISPPLLNMRGHRCIPGLPIFFRKVAEDLAELALTLLSSLVKCLLRRFQGRVGVC